MRSIMLVVAPSLFTAALVAAPGIAVAPAAAQGSAAANSGPGNGVARGPAAAEKVAYPIDTAAAALPPALRSELRQLLRAGRKTDAMMRLHQALGWDLASCALLVDALPDD